ncbi:MAG: DUF6798 domain-containing protein [Pseudomonadota bacterium]
MSSASAEGEARGHGLLRSEGGPVGFALFFAIIAVTMLDPWWTENEAYYLTLGEILITGGSFDSLSAMTPGSSARVPMAGLMGAVIEIFGDRLGLLVLRLLAITAYALSLAWLARTYRISNVMLAIALAVFLLMGQSYFAGAWMFGGVETKSFALACAIAGVAATLSGRLRWALILGAIGTYAHFLIGGFWFGAALLLAVLQGEKLMKVVRFGAFYALAVAPIVAALVYDTLVAPGGDLAALGTTAGEIYAERNSHHVAPFINNREIFRWLPGISLLGGFLIFFVGLLIFLPERVTAFERWLFLLNLYLAGCLLLAYLDRHTNYLSVLYIFRPNTLILLLSLAAATKVVLGAIGGREMRLLPLLLIVVVAAQAGPKLANAAYDYVTRPEAVLRIDGRLRAEERLLFDWIAAETPAGAVIMLEPVRGREMVMPWAAFEQISGRLTLVNFKYSPANVGELPEWYRRRLWRRDVFAGNCHLLGAYPVTHLLTFKGRTLERVAACGKVVYQRAGLGVVRLPDRQ